MSGDWCATVRRDKTYVRSPCTLLANFRLFRSIFFFFSLYQSLSQNIVSCHQAPEAVIAASKPSQANGGNSPVSFIISMLTMCFGLQNHKRYRAPGEIEKKKSNFINVFIMRWNCTLTSNYHHSTVSPPPFQLILFSSIFIRGFSSPFFFSFTLVIIFAVMVCRMPYAASTRL